jgi:hypothetical protein
MIPDMIDLTSVYFPLTQKQVDKANYKGGVKRDPRQKARYKVITAITVPGARALFGTAEMVGVNRTRATVKPFNGPAQIVEITGIVTDRVRNLLNNKKCVTCERYLHYFRVEDNGSGYHLNGYSQDHVMMTRDHIVPRSSGGPDHIDNYQMMCSPCNKKKASMPMEEFVERKLKNTLPKKKAKGKVMPKQLHISSVKVVREAVFTYEDYPGFYATFLLRNEHAARLTNSIVEQFQFKTVEEETILFVPEGQNLEDYCEGHNELLHFEHFAVNALEITSLEKVYTFNQFDRIYFRQVDGKYRKLTNGSIIELKEE